MIIGSFTICLLGRSSAISLLHGVAIAAVGVAVSGCFSRQLSVDSFSELPGFRPHREFVLQANRRLSIESEGTGFFSSGDRFYYIAYVTEEEVPDTPPFPESTSLFGDPLWGEIQSLWKKRREVLAPEDYRFVVIDARAAPGDAGSRTRRAVYVSSESSWLVHHVSVSIFEYPGAELERQPVDRTQSPR